MTRFSLVPCLLAVLLNPFVSLAQTLPQSDSPAHLQSISRSTRSVSLPMAFEMNRGQAARGADFVARGQGYMAQLRANSVALGLSSHGEAPGQRKTNSVVQMTLIGANLGAKAVGEQKLPGYSNYLLGSDPGGWVTNVKQYSRVRYSNIYPGIDVVYHGDQSRVEHDFVVHPGANPKQIQLTFSGASGLNVTGRGDLMLQIASGELRLQKARAYQIVRHKQIQVDADYLIKDGRVTFRVGSYDQRRTLIIDPVVVYSTFLGGSSGQSVTSMAIDSSGNLYVAGSTSSINFPVTPGALQTTKPGCCEDPAFISKINPAGTGILWSTYISGIATSIGGLAIDSTGDAYICGYGFPGLPIPAGSHPFQSTLNAAGNHIAVLKLKSSGNAAVYASYLEGTGDDIAHGLAIDSAGDAYVTGSTSSNDFPLQNPLQSTMGPNGDSFVTEFNPTGSALVYSTYLGGNSSSTAFAIAIDSSANAYVVGQADTGFPTVSAYQSTCSGTCAFITKINSGGSSLAYSTFLGSEILAIGPFAVALDASGSAYVTGSTSSTAFPLLNPIQSTFTSNQAAFVAEFTTAGALQFSTYLGDGSTATGLSLDSSNNIYVTGSLGGEFAGNGDITVVNPIFTTTSCSYLAPCGFVSELSAGGGALVFSSYVFEPQSNLDRPGPLPNAVAVDGSGNIYAAGYVSSYENTPSLPVFDALQPLPSGGYIDIADGFIMKISPSAGAAAAVTPSLWQFFLQQVGTSSGPAPITVYNLGTDPLTVTNATTTGDFSIPTNGCSAVGISGASCTINVTFIPTATGTRTGSLIITDSSPGSPHTVALTGLGGEPTLSVNPTSLNFGNQAVGSTSAYQTVALSATGGFNIPISRVDITGDFAETQLNCGVLNNDGAPCQIRVTFTPTATGTRTGTLTVTDTGVGSPQIIPLTGTGVPPGIGLGVASGGSSSATVAAGATAKYSLSIGGLGMSGTASLSCSGAPSGATCSVPASESLSATKATSFDATVTTTAATGSLHPFDLRRTLWLWAVFLAGWVVLPAAGRKNRLLQRSLFLSLVFLGLCSCGGGSSPTPPGNGGTPAGSYTLTVTATMGSTTQSLPLKLTVQ